MSRGGKEGETDKHFCIILLIGLVVLIKEEYKKSSIRNCCSAVSNVKHSDNME